MIFGAKTDQGKVREQNQDTFGYKNNLFVVADGMGGHQAGEIASSIAVETILTLDLDHADENSLREIVEKANQQILEAVSQNYQYAGMGTTVAILLLLADKAYVAHVGDSRVYRLVADGSSLERLTKDHSLVAELLNNGEITESEAKNHPQRNILTRALGSKGGVEVDIINFAVQPGEKLLLCSDGLTGMLSEDDIKKVLSQKAHPQLIADELVELANSCGGVDNITVIVVEI